MSPDEMLEQVANITVVKVIKFGIPRTGLTSMDYLRERLREIAPDDDFSKLKRKLSVGATNLNTGKFQLFSEGPLHEPVAASCSIPFVFKPVLINDQLFVDGGIISNMPVDPIRDEVDFLIGSSLIPDSELSLADLSSVISISWRTFDLSVRANSAECGPCCDLLLEPPDLANHNIFSLKKIQEIHDIGYAYTKAKLEKLAIPSSLKVAAK
jgi:NTE family protein